MPGYQRGFNGGMSPMQYRGPNPRYEDPDPNSEQFRKIFIGGLNFNTTEENLKKYFCKWGEICDCCVMRDQHTKQSRGFGFITFKERDSVDEVQRDRKHKIDSRDVETKRAMPRDDPYANNQLTVCKMFVGGLKDDTTEEMVRSVFSEFGNIKEVEMLKDKSTGKTKGFCFVTFDDYDPVDKCVLMRRISLNTRKVEVKKAYAKGEMDRQLPRGMGMNMGMGMGQMPMSRGGRGDYVGGYNRDFPRDFYAYGPNSGMGGNFNGGGWQHFNDGYYQHGNPRSGYNNYNGHGGAYNRR